MALLLYGITRAGSMPDLEMTGGGGAAVESVRTGSIVMLASHYEGEELSPRRRNLSEFQKVVNAVAARTDILPSTFGLLSDDAEQVRALLDRNAALIESELARIAGCLEFSLRIRWNGENIFAWFVERFDSLRVIRDRYFEGGRIPTQDERLQLGKGFEHLLTAERAQTLRRVTEALGPQIDEWRELSHPSEATLCSLALLVRRQLGSDFDGAIETLAGQYDDNHVFELLGPWPPYSFTELRLE